MLRVGLTSGIACGKSAVAGMLREMGMPVIDADSIAHRLIERGQPAYAEVVKAFGPDICGANGEVDRARLGTLVFADREKLERLNRILHPRVIEAQERQLAELERSQPHGVAFVEAALILEAGAHRRLDRLVVAWCRPEQQLERLRARGMSEEEARRRIASQMPLEEKKGRASDLIDCTGSLDETRRQVEELVRRLQQLVQ